MAITITIQAASDAVMTETGNPGGPLLVESDLRKVYGLPNQYVGSDNKLYFVDHPRWDTIALPLDKAIQRTYVNGVAQNSADAHQPYMGEEYDGVDIVARGKHRPPSTTAFQLRCNSISHDVSDMTGVSPLPGVDNASGAKHDAGTPGQLNNIVIALGMRTETIKLDGVLTDEGEISAANPRKQVLLNIARLQYFKTGRSMNKDRWGGVNGGPLNPRAYTCLTIYDQELNTAENWGVGDQPSGTNLSYRGIVKSLSFRQDGGLPNRWFWNMEFLVLQNEHQQGSLFAGDGMMQGVVRINRIRLVEIASGNANNADGAPVGWGTGATVPTQFPTGSDPLTKRDPSEEDEEAYAGRNERWDPNPEVEIEIRTASDIALPIRMADDTISTDFKYTLENLQPVTLTNTNSTPPIDGTYMIYKVDGATNTFRLQSVLNTSQSILDGDEDGVGRYVNAESSNEIKPSENCWSSAQNDGYDESIYWDDGSDGYITFHGPGDVAKASPFSQQAIQALAAIEDNANEDEEAQ